MSDSKKDICYIVCKDLEYGGRRFKDVGTSWMEK